MGIGGFIRRLRGDRHAMPDPDSAEFKQTVEGSALPGSVEMNQPGWASTGSTASPEAPGTEAPGMPAAPADQAAWFGAGSGQAGPVSPEALVAAGVPPEHARAAATAYAQVQQIFGGGAMNVGDGSGEHGGSHKLDVQGLEGLRDEMRATMREHGVDPDSGVATDASSMPGLQEALLRVLAQHGVDISQYGR